MKRRVVVVAAVAGLAAGYGWIRIDSYRATPLVEFVHVPRSYARRAGDLSANVVVAAAGRAESLRFRVNDGPWREAGRWSSPRNVGDHVSLEMPIEDLRAGENRVRVEIAAPWHRGTSIERGFRYDPSPVELPARVDWSGADLDVQDGHWEVVERDGGLRVRPVPGDEGYDRLLLVTGSFAGGRRIRSDVVFRHHSGGREYGFGLLSMWDGHPDDWTILPRRGWAFALAWFWSKPNGAGSEISLRRGAEDPVWLNSYRNLRCEPDSHHRFVVEVFPVRDAEGRFTHHRQRLKWWLDGQPEPDEWIDLDDREGCRLPEGEYAVALLAYGCQVEFGAVEVEPLAR